MNSPQMFTFSWSELTSSLASTAQQLHQQGDLVDVTLSAGGKIFQAHKLVLSAASPLLMEMLKGTKCSNPVVMLAGISADDLEAILQFIYHGEVTIDPVRLPCLLQAAQCMDIRALSPPPSFDKIVPSSASPSASHSHHVMKVPAVNTRSTIKKERRNKVKVLSDNDDEYNRVAYDQDRSEMYMNEDLTENEIGEVAVKRAYIVSDLPVSCHICGAVIRQSRNLRRHMELVHMRADYSHRAPKKKKSGETPSPSLRSSSPSVGFPVIHEESQMNGMDCYAPSAQRVMDSCEDTVKRHHQDFRPASQDSQSPPDSSYTTHPNQAHQQTDAPPAAHTVNSSTSSIEAPPRQPGYASGNVDPSHILPPQPHLPPQTHSGHCLSVYPDIGGGNS